MLCEYQTLSVFFLNESFPCRNSELVSPFIFRMSSVSLDPMPLDPMGCCQVNEFLPEILIQYLPLPAFGAPAVALPILQPPLCEGVSQITGIGVQLDLAGALQGLQGLDSGLHFHAIIGGLLGATAQLTALTATVQMRAPAAGAWITAASSVGVNGANPHGRESPSRIGTTTRATPLRVGMPTVSMPAAALPQIGRCAGFTGIRRLRARIR